MKNKVITFLLAAWATGNLWAAEADSLKVVDIEEVLIISTPKENRKLRELPNAVTLLSQQDLQATQVNSIKNLTGLVPNFFIPDYGSKLTSAIYIRGIGSRINTSSVGLYVDNIPYIDKSAFDFNYADIERIDVLRGPQGTLYGRNAMGGIIKIHTKSPFSYQGTDVRLGVGTHHAYNASVTHYHRISDRFAFSTGGFYDYTGGFFRNAALNNKKIDKGQSAGGRFRGIYLPADNWKLDLSVSYEYSDEGGYPYGLYDKETGITAEPAYNEESSYYRNLFNAGFNLEHQMKHVTLSAVTGYQHLKDRMFLDQDFTPAAIYTLEQKQRLHTLSEEVVLKSKHNQRWQWSTGVFGLYQWLKTDAPVVFKEEGVSRMLEANINGNMPSLGNMANLHIDITNPTLLVDGSFDTPVLNAALFHQSTFNNLGVKGLSATIGARLEYEKNTMKYRSGSDILYNFTMESRMLPQTVVFALQSTPNLQGKLKNDYTQLLPKFSLQYEWKKGNNLYATVSKGYRSGGYNIQMFSDLIQHNLQNSMQGEVKESVIDVFNQLVANGMPQSVADMIISQIPDPKTNPDVRESTIYKPEYSWNYEVGSHLTLWKGKLWADLAAFYLDTRDQQVSRFAPSGLGRVTANAGKSHSYGAEVALRASFTNAFSINASYGYTYATFKEYVTNERVNGELQDIDYKGHYVPFTPKHTLTVGGQYIFHIRPDYWLDRIQLNANYTGAGRIYWTEQNDISQSFYGTLNGRLSLQKGNGQIDFWVRNALDKEYATFYFESMGNGFQQKGRPVQAGIEIRCQF